MTAAPTRRGTPPAPSTIERALGRIQSRHRLVGHLADTSPARVVLREYRAASQRPRKVPPADIDVLRRLIDATNLDGFRVSQRNRVLVLLGFALMACRSELAAFGIPDVTCPQWHGDQHPNLQDRPGRCRRSRPNSLWQLPGHLPGAHATTDWKADLCRADAAAGSLLRSVDRHGRLAGTESWRGTGGATANGLLTGAGDQQDHATPR